MAVRWIFKGNPYRAALLQGRALSELRTLHEAMKFQGLSNLTRTVTFPDGSVIHCHSVFGQDIVTLVPAQVPAGLGREAWKLPSRGIPGTDIYGVVVWQSCRVTRNREAYWGQEPTLQTLWKVWYILVYREGSRWEKRFDTEQVNTFDCPEDGWCVVSYISTPSDWEKRVNLANYWVSKVHYPGSPLNGISLGVEQEEEEETFYGGALMRKGGEFDIVAWIFDSVSKGFVLRPSPEWRLLAVSVYYDTRNTLYLPVVSPELIVEGERIPIEIELRYVEEEDIVYAPDYSEEEGCLCNFLWCPVVEMFYKDRCSWYTGKSIRGSATFYRQYASSISKNGAIAFTESAEAMCDFYINQVYIYENGQYVTSFDCDERSPDLHCSGDVIRFQEPLIARSNVVEQQLDVSSFYIISEPTGVTRDVSL